MFTLMVDGGGFYKMVTQAQINNFKQWARQQGYSELQISQEIARKQQEETKKTITPTKTQAQPITQTQPVQTTQPTTQPVQQTNLLSRATQNVASFLIPRATTFAKTVSGALNLKSYTEGLEKANSELYKQSSTLITKAKRETDPTKKMQFLQQSRELTNLAATNTENLYSRMSQYQEEAKITGKEELGEYALRQGVGIAGEAATWILPIGKIVQGARLIKGASTVSKILKAGMTGGLIGGIYGITTPEDVGLGERGKRAITGAATGAAVSGALRAAVIPIDIVKNFVKGNNTRIYRLFKLSPSERVQFDKSTGGRDFAEELLQRDAKEMAGKDYKGLIQHFSSRLDDSVKSLREILKVSPKTVDKEILIKEVETAIKRLEPERGNVGQKSAMNALRQVLADLQRNPAKLSLEMANKIKTQLQDAGKAAFSPAGKATPSSKQLAKMSTFLKNLIEEKVPEAKEMNFAIQLYRQAGDSIKKTGAKEANKISNDIVQKLLQQIPALATLGGGVGGYAVAGPGGAVGGGLAALLITGGSTAMRVKYFSPEFQTALIGQLTQMAKSQGIKKASQFATRIGNEISKAITRKATQTMTDVGVSPTTPTQQQQGILDNMMKEQGIGAETQPTQDQVVQIRNRQTGEVKSVKQSELGQYGLGAPGEGVSGPMINKEDILTAMMVDMEQTSGKNLSKLATILSAYESVFPEEEEELSTQQKKRVALLQQASPVLERIVGAAFEAPTGLVGAAKARVGKIPGVTGGEAEYLSRDVEGFARLIASVFASEVGVATDKDVERWKAIMPQPGDTMPERVRQSQQLVNQIIAESRTLGIEIPQEILNVISQYPSLQSAGK